MVDRGDPDLFGIAVLSLGKGDIGATSGVGGGAMSRESSFVNLAQLVVVEPLAEPSDLNSGWLPSWAVDVDQRSFGQSAGPDRLRDLGAERRGD